MSLPKYYKNHEGERMRKPYPGPTAGREHVAMATCNGPALVHMLVAADEPDTLCGLFMPSEPETTRSTQYESRCTCVECLKQIQRDEV